LLSDGSVRCWGSNSHGELGNGSSAPSSATPVDVVGLSSGVKTISSWAGTYTCALTGEGGVKCWGDNADGELGNGSNTNSSTPVDVTGLTSGVTAIAAGPDHACAVTSGGGVKCWGHSTGLENGSTFTSSVPVGVSALASGITAVSVGNAYSCALTNAGGVKCWGNNTSGQLGNGSTEPEVGPVDVAGLSSAVRAIAAGESATCALMSTGGVKCWGGTYGNTPVDISGLTGGATAVYPLIQIACASMDGGGFKCWSASLPTAADYFPSAVRAIAYGGQTTFCVLLSEGGVDCASGNGWVPVAGLSAG
jgi:alpha-tubulin suppressor-like RCC1 family protein